MGRFERKGGSAADGDAGSEIDSGIRELRYGITQAQMSEIQEQFRKQREEYEHQNNVFIADQRKKALYR
jgi:hypothetical protein